MADSKNEIEQLAINTIRTLSMEAVQAANSGHPGTPMALAPAAYLLYNEVLRYNPDRPKWANRDRFVLSCGHASMLLYSMLHLSEVKKAAGCCSCSPSEEPAVSLEDIRQFRQLESACPGHPEYGETSGVETTSGPLGQGIANSVGMGIASRWLAARYNRPGFELFDFNTYVLCSDGDLMEGIGTEAASIAGHLKLSNICWIYDDNKITIEGDTSLAFSEDIGTKFAGLGWNVVKVDDINDLGAMRAAIDNFKQTDDKPTIIIVKSVIAYGAPNKANTHGAHGAPLGDEEIRLTKEFYGLDPDASFVVPEEVRTLFREGIGARGQKAHDEWLDLFNKYLQEFPEEGKQLQMICRGELPEGWDAAIEAFPADAKGMASRVSSGKVLNQLAENLPWMLGGSADLAPSNNSNLKFEGAGEFLPDTPGGRNFHYGIREHAMAAITNGMALSGLRSYAATFFVFSDYMRPSMRLAALMKLPVFYILTHDSIGVGEDGPTHQPVEHLAALRAIPNLNVMRPADANEVAEAYKVIAQAKDTPTSLVLTRQALPTLDRTKYAPADGVAKGGYVLVDTDGKPDVILLATGSEVALCAAAAEQLADDGIKARVVSMPCWELFDAQDAAYREAVLPADVTARVGVEMGIEQGWYKYLGTAGRFIGMTGYGASAPAAQLLKHFGFTPENVAAVAKDLTGK